MPGCKEQMLRARIAIDATRRNNIPVILIPKMHRPDLVDFGRELDGDEDLNCVDDNLRIAVAVKEMGFLATDFLIKK
jgi:hypothetical protein